MKAIVFSIVTTMTITATLLTSAVYAQCTPVYDYGDEIEKCVQVDDFANAEYGEDINGKDKVKSSDLMDSSFVLKEAKKVRNNELSQL